VGVATSCFRSRLSPDYPYRFYHYRFCPVESCVMETVAYHRTYHGSFFYRSRHADAPGQRRNSELSRQRGFRYSPHAGSCDSPHARPYSRARRIGRVLYWQHIGIKAFFYHSRSFFSGPGIRKIYCAFCPGAGRAPEKQGRFSSDNHTGSLSCRVGYALRGPLFRARSFPDGHVSLRLPVQYADRGIY